MTTHVGGFPAIATPSQAGARDARQEEEDGRASFAGVLAGATQAQAQAQSRPVAKAEETDGTSELDASSDTDDAVGGDEGEKTQPATAKAEPTAIGIERSVAALDPMLQEKLARVIARMRDETGHDVEVGETYRSQSRQNTLYAQGRVTPGPVVTWTQVSKHTQGRAVDLVVDGGAAGSDAYALLRRIATEEGLRTLGTRDPGHLELPTTAATGAKAAAKSNANAAPMTEGDTASVASATPAEPSARALVSVARIAQLASTAPVARVAETHVAEIRVPQASVTQGNVSQANVAKPADVARVATIERPGIVTSIAKPATAPTPAPTQTVLAQNGANAGNTRFGASAEERGRQNEGGERGNSGNNGYGSAFGIGKHTTTQFTIPAMATDVGTTAAQRVAHVIAAREDAPARPLSQIVMSVDAGNGTTDRIQLNLRGASLNATIDAGDQRAAHAMSARSGELVRTLTREGMDVESLQVRAAASVSAPVAPDASQRSSDSSTSSRERAAHWQQQEDRRRSEDERRQQQRDERRGKES